MFSLVANICPNIAFSVTCLILLWKLGYPASHDPNIIGVQFQWDEYQLHEWGGGPFCKVPNIHQCCTQYTAQSSVPSLYLLSHSFNNDHYYHDPYSDMPRFCHLWIKPVPLGKYSQGLQKKWL